MQILIRITKITWQFRTRLILAYLSFFAAVGVSLLIPQIFGEAIDKLVAVGRDGVDATSVATNTLLWFALALLGASLLRGFMDFARTYCTDSLSQKVSYVIRNQFYDKLQHLSFAYHDKEHTGDLMSKRQPTLKLSVGSSIWVWFGRWKLWFAQWLCSAS